MGAGVQGQGKGEICEPQEGWRCPHQGRGAVILGEGMRPVAQGGQRMEAPSPVPPPSRLLSHWFAHGPPRPAFCRWERDNGRWVRGGRWKILVQRLRGLRSELGPGVVAV